MPRAKRFFATAVLVLSAVYAVWLAVVLTDYLALSHGMAPIFAQPASDGSLNGVLYSVSDVIMHVFGHDITV